MNDRDLRQFVTDALEFDPAIDAAWITVAVERGVVTLEGHVPGHGQRHVAGETAARVRGVRSVIHLVEVRLPADRQVGDDELARRAGQVLAWSTFGDDCTVHITADHGRLTLDGQVTWHYQRANAESALRWLSGITGLTNNIMLAPDPSPDDIRQRIHDAIGRHATVASRRIRLEVRDGGSVRIEGQVGSWEERQAVHDAAWSAVGARDVENRLQID